MQENFGIGDKVSFSLRKAKPKKKTFLKKVFNAFIYIHKKLIRIVRKVVNDDDHPVNSHN